MSILRKLIIALLMIVIMVTMFFLGRFSAEIEQIQVTQIRETISSPLASSLPQIIQVVPQEPQSQLPEPQPTPQPITWGGPELWEAVNQRRIEFGVNPLKQKDELCTIAAIRLNEILRLGRLDDHQGFANMVDRRPDLKWIFEKYNLYEFLASGAETPEEAVSLWENTLGHKLLLSGGELVWGCFYAANGYAVAIAAF
ncbi:hypothetical protein AMJ51_02005 [Microgenomates bacterium DG_75]|nr:MAG: hypothetical protein AMJ51_02005 [Microgenomates bacterium DG_75]